MLDLIFDTFGARILRKGIRVHRTVGEMIEQCEADAELTSFLKTLPADAVFDHETVNKHLPAGFKTYTRPEALFAYLRELRTSAEALLEQRGME